MTENAGQQINNAKRCHVVRPPFIPPPHPRSLSLLPTTNLKPIGCPSPLLRDMGHLLLAQWTDMVGRNKGGPKKWEAQAARRYPYLSNATTDYLGPILPPPSFSPPASSPPLLSSSNTLVTAHLGQAGLMTTTDNHLQPMTHDKHDHDTTTTPQPSPR